MKWTKRGLAVLAAALLWSCGGCDDDKAPKTKPDATVVDAQGDAHVVADGGTVANWVDPCPPDQTPAKGGWKPGPQMGFDVLGNTCAKDGWPTAPGTQELVFTEVTKDYLPVATAGLDACLLWRDLNGDGSLDLLWIEQPGGPGKDRTLRLFYGDGKGNFDNKDLPFEGTFLVSSCLPVDYDGDGDEDLALAGLKGIRLMQNVGSGFVDKSDLLPDTVLGDTWTVGALDFDRDGDLDLFGGPDESGDGTGGTLLQPGGEDDGTICKFSDEKPYTKCTIEGPTGTNLRLLRNDGAKGFVDVTPKMKATIGEAMSILAHDLDRDGWMDLFVGNDFGEHGWYRNGGDGTFAYHSTDIGMRPYAHLMGSTMADFDADGHFDLVMGDLGADTYYRGQAGASFVNDSNKFGIWPPTEHVVAWSQAAADLNNDGWVDLVTANSLAATKKTWIDALYYKDFDEAPAGGHLVWRNKGDGSMAAQTLPFPKTADQVIDSTVLAMADMEGDGDLDLMITHRPGSVQVYRNDTAEQGRWLRIELVPLESAPRGAGALVQIWRDGYVQERQATPAPGFGTDGSWGLHFGLGAVKELDEVRVWWPSGRISLLSKVAADQVLVVAESGAMTRVLPAADPDPAGDAAKGDLYGDPPWVDPCKAASPPEKLNKGATPSVGLPVLRNHCAKAGWPTPAAAKALDFADISADIDVDTKSRWQRCLLWRDLSGDDVPDLGLVRQPAKAGDLPVLAVHLGFGDGTYDKPVLNTLPADFDTRDCVAVDADLDGLVDIVLAGSSGLRLMKSKGIGSFVADQDLLPESIKGNPVQSVQSLDYDRDGRLDLYLGRFGGFDVDCGALVCKEGSGPYSTCTAGKGTKGQVDTLLRSTKEGFVDMTAAAKLGEAGIGGSVTAHDLDRDGWTDLFVGNVLTPSAWFRNQGNGTFVRLAASELGIAGGVATLGSALGDLDLDGHMDLLTSSFGAASLHRGQADGGFAHGGNSDALATASKDGMGSAVMWSDFDNDGWLDALATRPLVAKPGQLSEVLNCGAGKLAASGGHVLLHNDGKGKMKAASLPLASTQGHSLNGAAAAALDVDGDQDPDLALIDGDGVLRVLRNDTPSAGNALRVYLDASVSPPLGEGALVQVWVQGHVLERWQRPGVGHGASLPARLHFGLGAAKDVDELRVWWPSGRISVVPGKEIELNTSLVVHEADPDHTYVWGPPAPTIGGADASDAGSLDETHEAEDTNIQGSLIQPADLNQLATAKWTEITDDFGLPKLEGGVDKVNWAYCTIGADLTGDGSEDFALIKIGSPDHTLMAVVLDSGKPVIVKTTLDGSDVKPSLGCAAADIDADGLPDLLVGGEDLGARLYVNQGGGKFVDKSVQMLPAIQDFDGFSFAPGDFDGDGDLDVFVGAGRVIGGGTGASGCDEIVCKYGPYDYTCTYSGKPPVGDLLADRMWLRGAKWPMQDATKAFQLQPGGEGTHAAVVDMDLDGKVDLLVAEDFGDHRILHNTGKGPGPTLFNLQGALKTGFVPYAHAMGLGLGDFNGDGAWDVFVTDLGPHLLYLQKQKNPTDTVAAKFEELALSWGVAAMTHDVAGWSPIVADFDHDGRDDIYLATSAIAPKGKLTALGCATTDPSLPSQFDLLMLNQGTSFKTMKGPPVKDPEGLGFAYVAQAALDLDGDGDLDVVQVRTERRLRILRNDMPKVGGFVDLRLKGKGGNTGAVGATVTAKAGPVKMIRHLGVTGFGGTAWHRVHFGLGKAKQLDEVVIHWPAGAKPTVLKNVVAGTKVVTQP